MRVYGYGFLSQKGRSVPHDRGTKGQRAACERAGHKRRKTRQPFRPCPSQLQAKPSWVMGAARIDWQRYDGEAPNRRQQWQPNLPFLEPPRPISFLRFCMDGGGGIRKSAGEVVADLIQASLAKHMHRMPPRPGQVNLPTAFFTWQTGTLPAPAGNLHSARARKSRRALPCSSN